MCKLNFFTRAFKSTPGLCRWPAIVRVFAALLVFSVFLGSAKAASAETYEDCILEHMTGVTSDIAATEIRAACRTKHPLKTETSSKQEKPDSKGETEASSLDKKTKRSFHVDLEKTNLYTDALTIIDVLQNNKRLTEIKMYNATEYVVRRVKIGVALGKSGGKLCPTNLRHYSYIMEPADKKKPTRKAKPRHRPSTKKQKEVLTLIWRKRIHTRTR